MYYVADEVEVNALKNLPTTWGLRPFLKVVLENPSEL